MSNNKPSSSDALLNRAADEMADIDKAVRIGAGIHVLDDWETVTNPEPIGEPIGEHFDRTDPTTYSDLQVIHLANEYDKKLFSAEQRLRQVLDVQEDLDHAHSRGEFNSRRLRNRYQRLMQRAQRKEKMLRDNMKYLRDERDLWRNEARRRDSIQRPQQPPAIVASAFQYYDPQDGSDRDIDEEMRDGYEGIDDIETLRLAVSEMCAPETPSRISSSIEIGGLMPIGKCGNPHSLAYYQRAVKAARFDLIRKQRLRAKVKRFLRRKNLSAEKRQEGEQLLKKVENAVAKRMDEILQLRAQIRECKTGKRSLYNLPSAPTHEIKGQVSFHDDDDDDDDEEDDEMEIIGAPSVKPSRLKSWAKDKKRDYKQRLTKMGQRSYGPGGRRRGGDEGKTARQREGQEQKEAKRRVSELKKDERQREKQRKSARRQGQKAARQRRQQAVRGARKEEASMRKGVRKRRAASTREAKKEFDAARRRYKSKIQQTKRGATKELKTLRQQRRKKERAGRVSERKERGQARKTFGKPDKGLKKRIRGAEKQKKKVFGKRERRIKQTERVEKWQSRLQGVVQEQPTPSSIQGYADFDVDPVLSGYDIAEGLYDAAEQAISRSDYTYGIDGDYDVDDDDDDPESYATDAIMAHLTLSDDDDDDDDDFEDPELREMVEGYVGAWVSSAIGEEYCPVTQELGLTTSQVRGILDLHAEEIAEKLAEDYEDPEIGETWMDFHHTNAGLMKHTAMGCGITNYDSESGDHALIAQQLAIGVRGNLDAFDPDEDEDEAGYGYENATIRRYDDPYRFQYLAELRPRQQYMEPRPMRYDATHEHASGSRRGERYGGYRTVYPGGHPYRFRNTPERIYRDDVEQRLRGRVP